MESEYVNNELKRAAYQEEEEEEEEESEDEEEDDDVVWAKVPREGMTTYRLLCGVVLS